MRGRSEFAFGRARVVLWLILVPIASLLGVATLQIVALLFDSLTARSALLQAVERHGLPWMVVTYSLVVIGIALSSYGPRYILGRLGQYVVSRRLEVCPTCGYHISGIGPAGTCPECGRPFQLQEVQDEWKRILHSLELTTDTANRGN